METNNRWYVRRKDGKKDGSFSDAELAALISKGIVEPEDEISTDRNCGISKTKLARRRWIRS